MPHDAKRPRSIPDQSPGRPPATSSAPPALWLRLIGEPGLYDSEDATSPLIGPGKPLALLAYLLLAHRERAQRDHLAQLLWPDAPESEARHSLRQAVYRLNQEAGGTLVHGEGDDLVIQLRVHVDGLEGERALAQGDLSRAARILRGEASLRLPLPVSRDFDTWFESIRSRLHKAWAVAALHHAEELLLAGKPDHALEVAEGLAARSPFDDEPMRLILDALERLGRHATAVARYHAYAELLRRELELSPGPELTALAERLEHTARGGGHGPGEAYPLVGRERELTALTTAARLAADCQGGTVLIEGAAGLGKTRLLGELDAWIRDKGGLVLAAKCYEIDRTLPYGLVADLLDGAIDRPALAGLSPAWLAEAARLLPELRDQFPHLPATPDESGTPAGKRRLHQALVRCMEILAEDELVLIRGDDLHWADAASLEVLHQVARRAPRTRLLLALSYRPAELSPIARQFARALTGARLAQLLPLEALREVDVLALLSRVAVFEDPSLGSLAAGHLHQQSGGNPLFLSELLDALARAKVLLPRDGRWEQGADRAIENLPRTLGKLLADRIEALEPWRRSCVEVLAVFGGPVNAELLGRAIDLSIPRAELALRLLEEDRLLRRDGQSGYTLFHDELRLLAYQGIPDERRRLLHAAAGAVLEESGELKRAGGAARLAYHFDLAGDRERAHRFALQAAAEAEALAAPEARQAHLVMAEAHAPRALPPGSTDSGRPARRGVWVMAGVLALAFGILAFRWWPFRGSEAAPRDWRQGALYLTSGTGLAGRTFEVRWPGRADELATVKEVPRPPDFPPSFFATGVMTQGELHAKIWRLRGVDTQWVTSGSGDDAVAAWSPDSRLFLVQRGMRVSERQYTSSLFVLDTTGRVRARFPTGPWQDGAVDWSSRGTKVAISRDSAGFYLLMLCDADGSHPSNLTRDYALPARPGTPRFSPDGDRLAVLVQDTGTAHPALYVLDLKQGGTQRLPVPDLLSAASQLAWSPDGRWLAALADVKGSVELWMLSLEQTALPRRVGAFSAPPGVLGRWEGSDLRHLAVLKLSPRQVGLHTGGGVRLRVQAEDQHGLTMTETGLRWHTTDSSIATVDSLGFVRGLRPGSAMAVASAGGFVSDSVPVEIAFARVDTLLVEGWGPRLDTQRWRPYGHPRPFVVPRPGMPGRFIFFNNGDYNYPSGIISIAAFPVESSGLTLEVEAQAAFTGGYWQHWTAGFASPPDGEIPEWAGPRYGVNAHGHDPSNRLDRIDCSGEATRGDALSDHRWHRVAIQIRADGVGECYVDGTLLSRGDVLPEAISKPFAIVLGGMSVATRIYHGRVVVTRGLRY